jgi:predicted phage tail protein
MTDTLRTIRLYGSLGAKFGREFKLAVKSPAEAVQALCSQVPGFKQWLSTAKLRNEGYSVFVGKRNLKQEELGNLAEPGDIRIAPIILGSKNGGFFQIVLGVVLVILGAVATAYGYVPLGQALAGMGYSMIIGGVIQLLMPHPRQNKGSETDSDQEPSYAFNGPLNTQAQGHPVPLAYGRILAGSAVISAGITVDDPHFVASTGTSSTSNGALTTGGGWLTNTVRNFLNA